MTYLKANLFVILAASIFGVTSVIGKLSYLQGSNPTMLTFLRSLLCLPILWLVLKKQGIPLLVSKKQLKQLILLASVGSAFTTLAFCQSYHFIPVGTATTIHFVYPIFTALGTVLIFKEPLTRSKIIALTIATAGISFFFAGSLNLYGVILALISGLSYAFYILYLGHSELLSLPPLKLSFYLNLIIVPVLFAYGGFTQTLTLALTLSGWIYTFIISISCGIFAITLFQIGLKTTGGTAAAILSTFEPLASIFAGAIFLGEILTAKELMGSALILLSIIILTLLGKKETKKITEKVSPRS